MTEFPNTEQLKHEILHGKGGSVLLLTLNSEKTLNALSMEMLCGIRKALQIANGKSDIKCLVIKGAGKKAFSAGGDIKDIYAEMTKGKYEAAGAFFGEEYPMDYALSTYGKPCIALVDGIVMGGGAGVMQGCHFRVVTEKTRFAMPETLIGFFPDVGANHFLNKIPKMRIFQCMN